MKKIIYSLLAIAVLWFVFLVNNQVSLGPGVLAPNPPKQVKIIFSKSFSFKEHTITPLAKFHIEAKVLSKKNYNWGRESNLSPVDLALGWGKMSDESVLDSIDISQSNRWYRWRTDKFPISRRKIETHSANMHLIPANKAIESMINRTRIGNIVKFSGNLIRVDAEDGWYWLSSLSRADRGDHSCELIWVEKFEIQKF